MPGGCCGVAGPSKRVLGGGGGVAGARLVAGTPGGGGGTAPGGGGAASDNCCARVAEADVPSLSLKILASSSSPLGTAPPRRAGADI